MLKYRHLPLLTALLLASCGERSVPPVTTPVPAPAQAHAGAVPRATAPLCEVKFQDIGGTRASSSAAPLGGTLAAQDVTDPNGSLTFKVIGVDIFVTGGAGGVRATTPGSSTSTQLSTAAANLRQAAVFAGQLYVSSGSGTTLRIGTVGTGTPTTAGQTITNLPGFPASAGSPFGFLLADPSAAVPGPDTLYVADDGAGLQKYSLEAGSWTAKGTVGGSGDFFRGLTGTVTGGTVNLYATSASRLVTLSDTSGYGGTLTGSPVTLATAPTNTAYRGVTISPR